METSDRANIQGHCVEPFKPVPRCAGCVLDDRDIGASVAVFVDGEPVVDLWGGWVDEASGRPWASDTITCTFSITKIMTALCALVLVDRGLLDLDAPVDRYWPEFAAADKSAVLVRHLLGHTAGLTRWDEPATMADIYAWEPAVERLAQQPCQWPPGSAAGYHALTLGHLVGEVIRRVSGRTVGEFFAEEVAGPLGADIHIGLGAEHDHRVAPSLPGPDRALADLENELLVGVWGPPAYDAATANSTEWRRAEIPAGNAYGNARSVAAVQSVLAGGGEARGVRLLSEATCQRVFEVQADGVDKCLSCPSAMASATASRRGPCLSCPKDGPATGVGEAAPWSWSTSTPA